MWLGLAEGRTPARNEPQQLAILVAAYAMLLLWAPALRSVSSATGIGAGLDGRRVPPQSASTS